MLNQAISVSHSTMPCNHRGRSLHLHTYTHTHTLTLTLTLTLTHAHSRTNTHTHTHAHTHKHRSEETQTHQQTQEDTPTHGHAITFFLPQPRFMSSLTAGHARGPSHRPSNPRLHKNRCDQSSVRNVPLVRILPEAAGTNPTVTRTAGLVGPTRVAGLEAEGRLLVPGARR